jgi:hypothetical protein
MPKALKHFAIQLRNGREEVFATVELLSSNCIVLRTGLTQILIALPGDTIYNPINVEAFKRKHEQETQAPRK